MKIKLPITTIILMVIFFVVGTIIIVSPMPMGPANIDWGVWLIAYFGYIYLVFASYVHIKKNN